MREKDVRFNGKPTQLRAMYEHGKGVNRIMSETGMSYAEVQENLRDAGTNLRTGGPTKKCKHKDD